MHFSFNLLRISGRYMFRTLLAHPQEAVKLQPCHSQLILYARSMYQVPFVNRRLRMSK
jgi:hypothetical protein